MTKTMLITTITTATLFFSGCTNEEVMLAQSLAGASSVKTPSPVHTSKAGYDKAQLAASSFSLLGSVL